MVTLLKTYISDPSDQKHCYVDNEQRQLKYFKFGLGAFKDREGHWEILIWRVWASILTKVGTQPTEKTKQKIQLWVNTSQKCSFSYGEQFSKQRHEIDISVNTQFF